MGNVLHELGEYEEARRHYIRATELNHLAPEVWKNLGTTFHQLRMYEEELRCYDRALELQPNLVQGLASKGVTLGEVHERYDDGLRLIDEAIRIGDGIIHWPHIHFWKARLLLKTDAVAAALQAATAGLRIAPDHKALIALKARLLALLWPTDDGLRAEAKAFYASRVRARESEFASWFELAKIAHCDGAVEDAFSFLSGALGIASGLVACGAALQHLASVEDLLCLCNDVEPYVDARTVFPIDAYVPEDDADAWASLASYLWVTFGVAFGTLVKDCQSSLRQPAKGSADLEASFSRALQLIARAIVTTVRVHAHEFRDRPKQARIEAMARIATLPYLVYIQEAAALFGVIAQQQKRDIPADFFERVLPREDDAGPVVGLLDEVIGVANDVLKLFPTEGDQAEEG
jgi:tetratricopeptide (TPR) repeat protein